MEYIGNLMEVHVEAEVFVEVAFGKIMDGLKYEKLVMSFFVVYKWFRGGVFKYLWSDRNKQWTLYNSSNIGTHPIKLGSTDSDLKYRKQ